VRSRELTKWSWPIFRFGFGEKPHLQTTALEIDPLAPVKKINVIFENLIEKNLILKKDKQKHGNGR
jgi:hypothetical protein